jgi:hypothetical protein
LLLWAATSRDTADDVRLLQRAWPAAISAFSGDEKGQEPVRHRAQEIVPELIRHHRIFR